MAACGAIYDYTIKANGTLIPSDILSASAVASEIPVDAGTTDFGLNLSYTGTPTLGNGWRAPSVSKNYSLVSGRSKHPTNGELTYVHLIRNPTGESTFERLKTFKGSYSNPKREIFPLYVDNDFAHITFREVKSNGDGTITTKFGLEVYSTNPSPFSGRVVYGDERIPVENAAIEILPFGTSTPLTTQTPIVTDKCGNYRIPAVPKGEYTVRARLNYTDPFTNESVDLVNYPDWDPSSVSTLDSSGVLPNLNKYSDIMIPYPVMLQAGWNGSSLSLQAYQDFLREDPLNSLSKSIKKLPATVAVAMPSEMESTEGYFAGATALNDYSTNANKLRTAALKVFQEQILSWLPVDYSPVNFQYDIIGHSMGGIIGRAAHIWGSRREVRRLVSLDAPNGGSWLAELHNAALPWEDSLNALTPKALNGISLAPNTAPTFKNRGWNYNYPIPAKEAHKFLLFGCDDTSVFNFPVVPAFSAFGEGFTTLGTPSPSGGQAKSLGVSSGYSEKFVHGIERTRNCAHFTQALSFKEPITLKQEIVEESAEYLAYNKFPNLQVSSPPPSALTSSAPQIGKSYYKDFSWTGPGNTASRNLEIDSVPSVDLYFTLGGKIASYALFDPSGVAIDNALINQVQLEGETVLLSLTLFQPMAGRWRFEYTAQNVPGNQARMQVAVNYEDDTSVDVKVEQAVVGQPLKISASLVDSAGQVLVKPGMSCTGIGSQIGLPPYYLSLLIMSEGTPANGIFTNVNPAVPAKAGKLTFGIRCQFTENQIITNRIAEVDIDFIDTTVSFGTSIQQSGTDKNSDSKFDELTVMVPVTLTKPEDTYVLVSEIISAAGAVVASVDQIVAPGNGLIKINNVDHARVDFETKEIVASGIDGPWSFRARLEGPNLQPVTMAQSNEWPLTVATSLAGLDPVPLAIAKSALPQKGSPAGGYDIYLKGTDLDTVTKVQINGKNAEFQKFGPENLKVTIPTGLPALSQCQSIQFLPGGGTGPTQNCRNQNSVVIKLTNQTGVSTFKDLFKYGN